MTDDSERQSVERASDVMRVALEAVLDAKRSSADASGPAPIPPALTVIRETQGLATVNPLDDEHMSSAVKVAASGYGADRLVLTTESYVDKGRSNDDPPGGDLSQRFNDGDMSIVEAVSVTYADREGFYGRVVAPFSYHDDGTLKVTEETIQGGVTRDWKNISHADQSNGPTFIDTAAYAFQVPRPLQMMRGFGMEPALASISMDRLQDIVDSMTALCLMQLGHARFEHMLIPLPKELIVMILTDHSRHLMSGGAVAVTLRTLERMMHDEDFNPSGLPYMMESLKVLEQASDHLDSVTRNIAAREGLDLQRIDAMEGSEHVE